MSDASAAGKDLRWVKSSLSFANGDCVQVARLPDGRVAFLGGVHNDEFTLMLAG
jgi:hypothetical protein